MKIIHKCKLYMLKCKVLHISFFLFIFTVITLGILNFAQTEMFKEKSYRL